MPCDLKPRDVTVPDHHGDSTRNPLIVDVKLHGRADALQTLGRQTQRLRFSSWQILRKGEDAQYKKAEKDRNDLPVLPGEGFTTHCSSRE
jgi:hypothetical protein